MHQYISEESSVKRIASIWVSDSENNLGHVISSKGSNKQWTNWIQGIYSTSLHERRHRCTFDINLIEQNAFFNRNKRNRIDTR